MLLEVPLLALTKNVSRLELVAVVGVADDDEKTLLCVSKDVVLSLFLISETL